MKLKTTLLTNIIALAALSAAAQFSVTLTDGAGRLPLTDATVEPSDAAASGFTIGGIDVASISEIAASALAQEPQGSVITDLPAAEKPVAILDLTGRNKERESSTRNLYSSEYMLEVAGLPFFTTSSLDEAVTGSSMILLSSPWLNGSTKTFTPEEAQRLADYVSAGGLIVSPLIDGSLTPEMETIFGISARTSTTKTNLFLDWVDESYPELVYIDEPEETTTRLGSIRTSVLTPSTAVPFAYFGDAHDGSATTGKVAVVKNTLGSGAAYLFSFSWSDVIQRPQLNKDSGGSRGTNNTFEPSADMVPLFLRAAHAANRTLSAWKFTVPDGYSSVLIPTHDCDSRTAFDEMFYLSDYEKELGFSCHYFLTVHYFRQKGYLSAFYNDETIPLARKLIEQGHTVGSHSICHFPDFHISSRFPMTEYTEEEYAAYATHDMDTGISTGSTWAELVLSKRILERDLANNVRSFRSGHLCVNDNMPLAHKIADYEFSSCYAAPDLLSQFPFIQRMNNNWEGEPTGTLQIPLHFSDVFSSDKMTEENWAEKPAVWLRLFDKLKGNYASSVILIHPNREWKMLAEKMLVESLDLGECSLFNFEDYGDFWINRRDFSFTVHHSPADGKVTVRAASADIEANPHLGIFVEYNSSRPLESITLVDETGTVRPSRIRRISDTQYILLI
ncbi:MAG: hypothetical protein NC212_04275 [Staphylococcus sp.]|nr:hypothetical protein [Staphylococcus sp.]